MSFFHRNALKPFRATPIQYVEFLLLQKLCESGIEFLLVGSAAAFAYGVNSVPQDLDVAVDYQRERWQSILTLSDIVDPQPGGSGQLQREPISFPTQMHVGFGRGLDVLSGFRHASFSELYSRSEEASVKVEGLDDLELPVRLAALHDLVESWRARGEPRDLELIRRFEKCGEGAVRDSSSVRR